MALCSSTVRVSHLSCSAAQRPRTVSLHPVQHSCNSSRIACRSANTEQQVLDDEDGCPINVPPPAPQVVVDMLLGRAASRMKRGTCSCLNCKGSGTAVCPDCKGSGLVKLEGGAVAEQGGRMSNRCHKCHGVGKLVCESCRGSGMRHTAKEVTVSVPAS